MFGFGNRSVRIPAAVYARAAARARAVGAASVAAYLAALIDRDAGPAEDPAVRQRLLERMRSLGYAADGSAVRPPRQ